VFFDIFRLVLEAAQALRPVCVQQALDEALRVLLELLRKVDPAR
jgi:hypothetical protein